MLASAAAVAFTGATDPAGAAGSKSGTELRFGTFNIQSVSLDRRVGEQRPWRERRATVISEIYWNRLDVLGIQEANPSSIFRNRLVNGQNQYSDLRNGLNARGRSYALVNAAPVNCVNSKTTYKCVRKDRNASGSDRILYNTQTVKLLGHDSMRYKSQCRHNGEQNLAFGVFRAKASGREFLFTNTHLCASNKSVRMAQLRELIAKVNSVKGSRPVINVGDYNTGRLDPLSKTLLPAMKNNGYGDVLNQQFGVNPSRGVRAKRVIQGWVNSVNHLDRNVRNTSYDTDHRKTGNHVDYIFASNNLPVTEFKVVYRFDRKTYRVNGVIPSDHNMIRANIVL